MARLPNFLLLAMILLVGPGRILREKWTLSDSAAANEMQKDIRDNTTPPARDPKLAVEEEYQLARQKGTVQALELFIARHPEDPLAEKARGDLRQLPH